MTTRLRDVIRNPYSVVPKLGWRGMLDWMPDKMHISFYFRAHMGYWMNWDCPGSFNEKIQWLKLYDRKPEYTIMADKIAVKKYVSEKLGPEYVIPLLDVYENPEEIDFERLPDRFVLKCSHNSGKGVVICRDRAGLDIGGVKRELNDGLDRNFYMFGREWVYKDIPRKILAEKYMEDETGELRDFKVFNFNGEPRLIQVDSKRFSGHRRNLYSVDWEYINVEYEYPSSPDIQIQKPRCLHDILKAAEVLSRGIPFVRTDFYVVNDKVYFGEMTFYPECGHGKFVPDTFDKELGSWLNLPEKNAGR